MPLTFLMSSVSNKIFTFQTLLDWRGVFREFSSQEEKRYVQIWIDVYSVIKYEISRQVYWTLCIPAYLFRIVVVRQTQYILPPLNNSSQTNKMLVDVVMRSILPSSHHILSAREVADAIETHLQIREDIWPSWTVRQCIR